jgi:hypothetical protein
MSGKPSTIRIGDLLIKVGILKESDLKEAMQVAGETGLPIGRVLIMSGYLGEHELKAALQAQSMMKDGAIAEELAFKALQLVSKERLAWEQALKQAGWVKREVATTNKLGELLLAAHIVTQPQLEEALKTSFETGLPVGRVLTLTGALSESLLAAVLNAQVMIRDGKITREQAIQGIRSAQQRRVSLEQCLIDHGYYRLPSRTHVKLGELFVLSGLISETDLMNVLELGLVNEQPLGQVIVQSGFISQNVLDAALRFQDMVANGTLTPLQAAEALGTVYTKGISIAAAVAEIGGMKPQPHEVVRLGELLKVAGLVTQNDIQKALELSTKNSSLVGKMLLVTGMIDEPTLHAALRCQFLIREGYLKMEQAIIALHYCQRSQVSFDDALEELGWTLPTRLRDSPPAADPAVAGKQ